MLIVGWRSSRRIVVMVLWLWGEYDYQSLLEKRLPEEVGRITSEGREGELHRWFIGEEATTLDRCDQTLGLGLKKLGEVLDLNRGFGSWPDVFDSDLVRESDGLGLGLQKFGLAADSPTPKILFLLMQPGLPPRSLYMPPTYESSEWVFILILVIEGFCDLQSCALGMMFAPFFRYHVPRSWVGPGENLLVLHEELGGDPSKISVSTRTGQEICSHLSESDPLPVDSWKLNLKSVSMSPEVQLSCEHGWHITSINFANYGTPEGECGKFNRGICHAESALQIVQKVKKTLALAMKLALSLSPHLPLEILALECRKALQLKLSATIELPLKFASMNGFVLIVLLYRHFNV
ncbi:hypothetical protein GIB67_025076 [Kingdonia uniflora]|uniref:SUEL-type lectin domain-containing protein n=1 Tax=Kingdonia uniflora TaxID=39325 RepID=A0A7J7N836_9MAGN|nr:hypothetical protein GIB67_025076 [Kingdonia uniflora]